MPNLGVAIPYFSGSRGDHMIPAVVFQVIWTSSQTYKKQRPSQPSRSPPGFARAARSSLLSVCGAITSHLVIQSPRLFGPPHNAPLTHTLTVDGVVRGAIWVAV